MNISQQRRQMSARLRAERAAERAAWRRAKAQAPRGALVLLDLGRTLVIFDNDAIRCSRAFAIAPPVRHLRYSKISQAQLLAQLAGEVYEVQIVPLAQVSEPAVNS